MYIITNNLEHDGYFYPRIPLNRLWNEDSLIKRICSSETLEGCLSSFPGGGRLLKNTLSLTFNVLKVFRVDIDKLDLKEEDVKTPKQIQHYVNDALLTNEYWITKPFQVKEEDTFYIYIHGWEEKTSQYPIVNKDSVEDILLIEDLDFDVLNNLLSNTHYSFELEGFMSTDSFISFLEESKIQYDIKRNVLLNKNTVSFKTNDSTINIYPYFKEWINEYKDYFKTK